MKTDKISRLVSALGNAAEYAPPVKPEKPENEASKLSSDAVKVAENLVNAGSNELESLRSAEDKAKIAAQVKNGTYQRDSRDIAAAVIRDLGL